MLNAFVKDTEHIYIACGPTDFRKQIDSLVALVSMQFKLDPFSPSCAFIFCNKRKNSIKVLRYDKNGFVLANKKLLDDLKFQWPKTPEEVKEVSIQQIEWLLQGLEMEPKKVHHPVKIDKENSCF
jgi:transposase